MNLPYYNSHLVDNQYFKLYNINVKELGGAVMARVNIKYESKVLGKETGINVVVPEKDYDGKYKCLYLLHGLGDDENTWLERSGIEKYAEKHGIVVVMPCAEASFYTNMKKGYDYYDYIAKELPQFIRETFNVSDKREDNFVAGLSMGGYGALKVGLRECGSFAAIGSLSPCGDIARLEGFDCFLTDAFGDELVVPEEDDILCLAKKVENDPLKPRIYLGIGLEDFLYENDKTLRALLEESKFDYTYRESHGMHNWAFWDEYIQYVLEWMLK